MGYGPMKNWEDNDARLRGWIVRERPAGHYQYYSYIYWREGGRMRKEYIPAVLVAEVKELLRAERKRRKRQEERRKNHPDVSEMWRRSMRALEAAGLTNNDEHE